jgi:hypothetical protein
MRVPYVRSSAVASTALLLLGAAGVQAASTDSATPDQIAQLADLAPDVEPSSELDGPTLVRGEVAGAGAGVPVVASAWPDQETLGDMKVGDTVDLVPFAAGLTDEDGRFELVADPAAVEELLGDDERIVNFDVTVPTAYGAPATIATSATLSVALVQDREGEPLTDDPVSIDAEVAGDP